MVELDRLGVIALTVGPGETFETGSLVIIVVSENVLLLRSVAVVADDVCLSITFCDDCVCLVVKVESSWFSDRKRKQAEISHQENIMGETLSQFKRIRPELFSTPDVGVSGAAWEVLTGLFICT